MDPAASSSLVDGAIEKLLPPGTRVTHVTPWGVCGWADTRRIITITADDEEIEYFAKILDTEIAEDMFRGECKALEKLHEYLPSACPKPFGWGEFESQPGTFFVLMQFLYLVLIDPSASQITDLVSQMHLATMGTSPGNMCGFYVPTCHGKVLQPNGWDPDWTSYFTTLMDVIYDADMAVGGPDPVYEESYALVRSRVIPRLLEALTSNGGKVVPVLLHGNLTQNNMGINEDTEEPMIYDPGMFYGHNEFELGMWRTTFVGFDESYRKQYAQRILPSEPASEWDDRIRLYSLFYHISHSAHWPGASAVTRRIIVNDMNYLIEKYCAAEHSTGLALAVGRSKPQTSDKHSGVTADAESDAAV